MSETFSEVLGQKPELMWVPVDKIVTDNNYQRDIKPTRVRQILREFNWTKFQPVMLAEQEDGSYAVFDGQHRVAAARAHPQISEVPAAVVRLESKRDEAGAFIGVNINRTAVTSVERYYAGLEAGDKDMLQLSSVLEKAGCEIVPYNGAALKSNRTNSVTTVHRAIGTHGEAPVIQACKTLSSAWPRDNGALQGVFIRALAALYRRNANVISQDRMLKVLSPLERKTLGTDAETIKKLSGGDAATALSRAICEIYNRGLSKNQISIAGPL